MLARIAPVTTVATAPQRNQNSAAGAITLLMAGLCSSGILGIDGVCTKLKYQSRPIHITPERTCSQRMKKRHQFMSPSLAKVPAISMMTTRMTTPAARVRPRDEKMAPMDFSFFLLWGETEKA